MWSQTVVAMMIARIEALSCHAAARCQHRNIKVSSVIDAVRNGRIIADMRGRQTFAMGRLRVVLGTDGVVVTVWRTKRA